MDEFVERMLKSAKENKKTVPQENNVEVEEIEKLTEEIKEKEKDK